MSRLVEARVIDLSTRYLGLDLPNPIVCGASPLTDDLDTARRLEDAGVAALVLRSLYAEQVIQEQARFGRGVSPRDVPRREASDVPPPRGAFVMTPDDYFEHLRRLRDAVDVPIVASINGSAPGRWVDHAALLGPAGASAVELNLHPWGADVATSTFDIETAALDTVKALRSAVKVPIAVKLSPFFTALARFCAQLTAAGADALVMFSHAFPADIDPETLAVVPAHALTRPSQLHLQLRWLAIVSSQVPVGLAASGGIHEARDVVKAVMAGADVAQMVSALLARGPSYVSTVRRDLAAWLAEHGYTSLADVRGRMSLVGCAQPDEHERSQTILALQRWQRGREMSR